MLSFETFLMQADIIESVGGLIVAAAALIGAVSAIVIAYINKQATGRKLTEQEKKIIAGAEFTQLGVQKVGENIGEIKALGKVFKEMALTPEQQKIADEKLAPLINTQTERIQTINDQIPHFTKILGVDVNKNTNVPRESPMTLRKINEDSLVS